MLFIKNTIRYFRKRTKKFIVLTKHFYQRLFINDVVAFEEQMQERIIGILSILAVLSGLLAFGFLAKYMLIPDTGQSWIEKLGMITFAMLIMGLIAVLEWDVIILDSRDYANLNLLPIKTGSLLTAKFTSLFLFVGIFALSINSISTLCFIGFLPQWQSSSLFYYIQFGLAHITSMFLAMFFAFYINVVIIGILMAVLGSRIFNRISAYIRSVLLILHVFAFSFYMKLLFSGVAEFKPLTQIEDIDLFLRKLSVYFPPMWFTDLYESLLGNMNLSFHGSLYYALIGLILMVGIFYLTTGIGYRRYLQKSGTSDGKKAHLNKLKIISNKAFNKTLLRNNIQRAVFYFYRNTLKTSILHRMQLASFIAVGVGIVSFQIVIQDIIKKGSINESKALISIPLTISFFLLLGLRENVNIPISLDANWIFQLTEKKYVKHYFSGLRKGIIVLNVLPLFILLFIFYVFLLGWVSAAYHCLFGFFITVLVMELFFLRYNKIPFACSYLPGKEKIQLFWIFYIFLFVSYLKVTSWIELKLLQAPSNFFIFYAVIILFLICIRVYQHLFFYRKISIKYKEEVEPILISLGI